MMQQYWKVKEQHQDCLIFYRLGDFYELFYEDAVTAAAELDITLTKRGKQEAEDIPMCGVPAHSHELYLAKLIQKGYKVAICEQLESPEEAKKQGLKGPLKRDVVRIVTAGTLVEEGLLSARSNNFLVALSPFYKGTIAVATIDVSTGYFNIESTTERNLSAVLSRLQPAEIILPDLLLQCQSLLETFSTWKKKLSPLPIERFDLLNAKHRLEKLYHVKTLQAFGDLSDQELQVAGIIVDYLHITQKQHLSHLQPPRLLKEQNFLMIDAATRRSLELIQTQTGHYKGSLLSFFNHTVTAAGSRLLNQYFSAPLLDRDQINQRLDQISFFSKNSNIRIEIRNILKLCPDLERALSRLLMGHGKPRDLGSIRQVLDQTPKIYTLFEQAEDPYSDPQLVSALTGLNSLQNLLNQALKESLPLSTSEGGFIEKGYDSQLDHFLDLQENSQHLIKNLQQHYIDKTSIPTLKIRHNQILGYYVEISPSYISKVPYDFIHRQSLVTGSRYTTAELRELEKSIYLATSQAIALENVIFSQLVQAVHQAQLPLLKLAQSLAIFDVAANFADLAEKRSYIRPILDQSLMLTIKEGRHPVVEQSLFSEDTFVANDIHFDEKQRLLLVTGPNMAGKSTYLRQNALIVILAQIGSFVPAKSAHIGMVDRIFSRVGAADDLAAGRSTFMVEMVETASILHQATPRSLVILDEIGRGTSTHDGLAIATAVTESLHYINQSRTLFATHYHELTSLAHSLSFLRCFTMRIEEHEGKIIFYHQVIPGNGDKSYGIHVASLAGLPTAVVNRAYDLLSTFEKTNLKEYQSSSKQSELAIDRHQFLTDRPLSKVEQELKKIDLNHLSPHEALNLLYHLKQWV